MSKDLHLNVNRDWFELIGQGYKTEEYREIKRYWISRLHQGWSLNTKFKEFDRVIIRNGYGRFAPELVMEFKGIENKILGEAESFYCPDEWVGQPVYAIKLGELIESSNWEPETIWAGISIQMKQP